MDNAFLSYMLVSMVRYLVATLTFVYPAVAVLLYVTVYRYEPSNKHLEKFMNGLRFPDSIIRFPSTNQVISGLSFGLVSKQYMELHDNEGSIKATIIFNILLSSTLFSGYILISGLVLFRGIQGGDPSQIIADGTWTVFSILTVLRAIHINNRLRKFLEEEV